MLDKPASALRLRERLLDSERLMEETRCYDGITELTPVRAMTFSNGGKKNSRSVRSE